MEGDSIAKAVMAAAIVLGSAPMAAAQVAPPAELRGSYAPGGDCKREPRVTLGDAITIQAGGQTARLAPLDACFSCAGGDRYQGIEVWVSQLGPDGPKEPFFRFNADGKKGALVVEKDGLNRLAPALRAVAAAPLKRCAK